MPNERVTYSGSGIGSRDKYQGGGLTGSRDRAQTPKLDKRTGIPVDQSSAENGKPVGIGYRSVFDPGNYGRGIMRGYADDPNAGDDWQRRVYNGLPQVLTPAGWRWDAKTIRNAFGPEAGNNIIGNLSKVEVDTNLDFSDPKKDRLKNLSREGYLDNANHWNVKDRLNQSGDPAGAGKIASRAVPLAAALVGGASIIAGLAMPGAATVAGGLSGTGAAGGTFAGGPLAGAPVSAGFGTSAGVGMPGLAGAGVYAGGPLAGAPVSAGFGTSSGVGMPIAAGTAATAAAAPGALSQIKDAISKYWPVAALSGLKGFTDYLGAEEMADRAEEFNEEQREWWDKNSLPKPEAIDAARIQGRNLLSENRAQSYENMARNLAARGFGSGSGLAVGGAEAIEGDYLKSLGTQDTELTKFANTRQFTPNYSPTSVPGGWESVYGTIGNVLGQTGGAYFGNQYLNNSNPYGSAAGMYAANQMLPKYNQTQNFIL